MINLVDIVLLLSFLILIRCFVSRGDRQQTIAKVTTHGCGCGEDGYGHKWATVTRIIGPK